MTESKVIIDLDALTENAKSITQKYSGYKYYIGVLKSEAYGHGEYVVDSLIEGGINYIAVSYLREALMVRKYNKDIPILIMQPIELEYINEAIKNNFTITIHDLDYLNRLLELNVKGNLNVHIKLDTGMNRLGFKNKDEVKAAYNLLESNKSLNLEGIYSHFATIGLFDKHYDEQVERFKELTSLIDLKKVKIVHFASSVITLVHPKIDFCNGIRTGILLYGYNVSPRTNYLGPKGILRHLRDKYYQKKYSLSKTFTDVDIDLTRALTLKTHLIEIKRVDALEYVGYGATYKAKKNMIIGVLPIGYNNGIGHKNNGRYVLINSKKCPIIGEISMNMCVIEIDKNVTLNDEVIVLGDKITLGMMSRWSGFGLAETLLEIGKNNKRFYLKDKVLIEEK